MLAFLVCNPLSMGVIGGVKWQLDYNASMLKGYADRNFRKECPAYKKASAWDRWFDQRVSGLGWCEPYLDRV